VSNAVVTFENVWKKFRRGERLQLMALRDIIPSLAARAFRRAPSQLEAQEFWALNDVSFEVKPGEALGVIGPNGAGKSTVLKLLTKIMKPNLGQCKVKGRLGTLIEVAAGFHPDLTGGENVYLQGAIMGMKKAEIARKFDEIVEFAGVTDFIDTPVKRYSSGMNARLGFSIAAHLDPDVLLIDEVLAVGDMAFQEKCIDRMQRFRDMGVAIVFVSHNLQAVSSLCNKVLVLRTGKVHLNGTTDEGIAGYAQLLQNVSPGKVSRGEAFVEIRNSRGMPAATLEGGEQATLHAIVSPPRTDMPLASALRIRRIETGEIMFFTTSLSLGCKAAKIESHEAIEFSWTFHANLARGHYSVEFLVLAEPTREVVLRLNPAAVFAVSESESQRGLVYLQASCSSTTAMATSSAE
jgi:lipopolysaccharide transport system ATP-binding protein